MENFTCEITNEGKVNLIATFKMVVIGDAGIRDLNLKRNLLKIK